MQDCISVASIINPMIRAPEISPYAVNGLVNHYTRSWFNTKDDSISEEPLQLVHLENHAKYFADGLSETLMPSAELIDVIASRLEGLDNSRYLSLGISLDLGWAEGDFFKFQENCLLTLKDKLLADESKLFIRNDDLQVPRLDKLGPFNGLSLARDLNDSFQRAFDFHWEVIPLKSDSEGYFTDRPVLVIAVACKEVEGGFTRLGDAANCLINEFNFPETEITHYSPNDEKGIPALPILKAQIKEERSGVLNIGDRQVSVSDLVNLINRRYSRTLYIEPASEYPYRITFINNAHKLGGLMHGVSLTQQVMPDGWRKVVTGGLVIPRKPNGNT